MVLSIVTEQGSIWTSFFLLSSTSFLFSFMFKETKMHQQLVFIYRLQCRWTGPLTASRKKTFSGDISVSTICADSSKTAKENDRTVIFLILHFNTSRTYCIVPFAVHQQNCPQIILLSTTHSTSLTYPCTIALNNRKLQNCPLCSALWLQQCFLMLYSMRRKTVCKWYPGRVKNPCCLLCLHTKQ